MTKVVVAMSMSLDGIAGPESADADGMAIFTTILGWQFPLRSWREQQGMEGGEDSVDSRVWAENFDRFGPQVNARQAVLLLPLYAAPGGVFKILGGAFADGDFPPGLQVDGVSVQEVPG